MASQTTNSETATIGRRGQTVIPAKIRRRYGIDEGSLVIFESTDDGILIKPAVALPIETYDTRRKAELILGNATDAEDYQSARQTVEGMGIDPDTIDHDKPSQRKTTKRKRS